MMHFGALEAGGTKMVLSLMDENGTMLERVSMPTLTPAETMPGMIDFFRSGTLPPWASAALGPWTSGRILPPMVISPPPPSCPGGTTPLWAPSGKPWACL